MPHDLADLLLMLKGKNVIALYRSGSRLYGCHDEWSDEDFVAVIAEGQRDLVRRHGVNIIVQTREQFEQALREHSMLALECYFSPPEARLKDARFEFRLDRQVLAAKAIETSTSDFKKAEKRWAEDLAGSKKKLYHSIRVLLFAVQIVRDGRITDYGAANSFWAGIRDCPGLAWDVYSQYVAFRENFRLALSAGINRRLPPGSNWKTSA